MFTLSQNSLPYLQVGLVPLTHLVAKHEEDATCKELAEVARLWGCVYRRLYVMRDVASLGLLERAISDMVWWRAQLVGDNLTQEEARQLRRKSADRIDQVNSKLGLEEVARDEDGERVRIGAGCVDIYQAYTHRRGMRGPRKEERRLALTNYHLAAQLVDVGPGPWLEETLLYCQLYSERQSCYVSERWCVPLLRKGPQTIFLDLGSQDQCLDLHLVVQVHRIGKIVAPDGTKQPQISLARRSNAGRSLTGQVSGWSIFVSHLSFLQISFARWDLCISGRCLWVLLQFRIFSTRKETPIQARVTLWK